MTLLRNIFGKKSPLNPIKRSFRQNRWYEVLALGSTLDSQILEDEERTELEKLLIVSGDRLAELNLEEGEACLRAGDGEKALEHFALAVEQARSGELAGRAEEALKRMKSPAEADPKKTVPGGSSCSDFCSESPTGGNAEHPTGTDDLDPSVRMDFILASYPPELQPRYRSAGKHFHEALQFIHNGEDVIAADLLGEIPENERDDLFHFELGALLGRLRSPEKGIPELEKALEANPDLWLALEALVRMEMTSGREDSAEKRLLSALSKGVGWEFCLGHLALVCARRGDLEKSLEYGLDAVENGVVDPDVLALTSTLLEKSGRLDEAEGLLGRLPSGSAGCAGMTNLNLAEFWLRNNRNLDRALESFKGAARNDTENPRWRLRIAQVYLAKGWKREGLSFLDNILSDPALHPELRDEGEALRNRLSLNS